MNKAPAIKGSAQARLLLYRLLSLKLTEAEQKLLAADSALWERIVTALEAMINSDAQLKSDQMVLAQAFSHI